MGLGTRLGLAYYPAQWKKNLWHNTKIFRFMVPSRHIITNRGVDLIINKLVGL